MYLTYNGVELQVEKIVSWTERNIYSEDNTERLMRHVTVAVQFVIHPDATNPFDVVVGPRAGAVLVGEVKKLLLKPRQSLTFKIGDTTVLQSPPPRVKAGTPSQFVPGAGQVHYVDAKTGPNPLYCDITQVAGQKTLIGMFAVETWLTDEAADADEQSALIANRWEQENGLDQDFFCVRTISGRAIFRGNFLYEKTALGDFRQVQRKPSDYLSHVAPPVPLGYKRESVRTRLSSDGLTLTYTIVDRELPTVPPARWGVSRIEAVWRSGHSRPGAIVTCQAYYTSLVVRVFGQSTNVVGAARRQDLINIAILVCQRFGVVNVLGTGAYYNADLTVDLVNRFVELSIGYRMNGLTQSVVGGTAIPLRGVGRGVGQNIAQNFPEDVGDLLVSSVPVVAPRPVDGILGRRQQQLKGQSLRDGSEAPSLTPTTQEQLLVGDEGAEAAAANAARGETVRRN